MTGFTNRTEAGRLLGEAMSAYADRPDIIVLALPRGGVPVGYEVARALNAPLDVFLVRKLGVPWQEELAMGAIASGGARVLNERIVGSLGISQAEIERIVDEQQRELTRRQQAYRGDRPFPSLTDRTAVVVDDGLATGASMRAAVAGLRMLDPAEVVVAVPTAPPESVDQLQPLVDEVVCLITPTPFMAVGCWYREFDQTTDREVRRLLEKRREELKNE